MATPETAPARRMCTECSTNPLRSDNRSGVCNDCRKGRKLPGSTPRAKKAAEPKKAPKLRAVEPEAPTQEAQDVAALTDDELARIAVAAAAEIRRRLALFEGALKTLEQARRAA